MLSKAEFALQVRNAYDHLYDLVYLRTHPLCELLAPDRSAGGNEMAWSFHHLLLKVIDDLDPGPNAPLHSSEWQRHHLAMYRYVDGMEPSKVASMLGISRRHYYRRHEEAVSAVAEILWEKCQSPRERSNQPSPAQATESPGALDQIQLIRLEAARVSQNGRFGQLERVTQGVLDLLQNMLKQHDMRCSFSIPTPSLNITVDRVLFRQMLLGILGLLIERSQHAEIEIRAAMENQKARLAVTVQPGEALRSMTLQDLASRFSAIEEMIAASGIEVEPIAAGGFIRGFAMLLPVIPNRMVLVVDDNEDVLGLFQRYLLAHHYQAVVTQTGQEALKLAHRLQPCAITLDLMMPDQDGWDLLQTLLNQQGTKHIPIIVCSVLRQRDLALSLGATAFLDKPVSEDSLVSVLDDVLMQRE